jgi:hypothetical protein
VGNWSSFQDKSSCAFRVSHSHHSLDDSSTIHFCRCLTLGRARKYNRATITFQPMLPNVPSKGTIVVLRQLHPSPLDHVPPFFFN